MQLAVRAEKSSPPSHSAVCEAAAMAVVRLLTDPRSTGGEWYDSVRRWGSGRIRKVTRRARGARWLAVQELPGVTVDHAGAQARAFVPGPVTEVPPELAKLQIAGLDLTDGGPDGDGGAAEGDHGDGDGRADSRTEPDRPYAVIALDPNVTMTTGKAAAQCGHAAQLLLLQLDPVQAGAWTAAGLMVHLARDVPWRDCVQRADVAVRDAGFTEVPAGSMTAVAWFVPA
jgi:peptidyl-tRNA hydrolase